MQHFIVPDPASSCHITSKPRSTSQTSRHFQFSLPGLTAIPDTAYCSVVVMNTKLALSSKDCFLKETKRYFFDLTPFCTLFVPAITTIQIFGANLVILYTAAVLKSIISKHLTLLIRLLTSMTASFLSSQNVPYFPSHQQGAYQKIQPIQILGTTSLIKYLHYFSLY